MRGVRRLRCGVSGAVGQVLIYAVFHDAEGIEHGLHPVQRGTIELGTPLAQLAAFIVVEVVSSAALAVRLCQDVIREMDVPFALEARQVRCGVEQQFLVADGDPVAVVPLVAQRIDVMQAPTGDQLFLQRFQPTGEIETEAGPQEHRSFVRNRLEAPLVADALKVAYRRGSEGARVPNQVYGLAAEGELPGQPGEQSIGPYNLNEHMGRGQVARIGLVGAPAVELAGGEDEGHVPTQGLPAVLGRHERLALQV